MFESSVQLDALPGVNTTLVVNTVHRRLGGPALNMASHLASLGHAVHFGGVVGRWDEALLRDQLDGVPLDPHYLCWADGSSDMLFYFKTEQNHSSVYQLATLPDDLQVRYMQLADGADMLILAGSRHVEIRRLFAHAAAASPARWKVFAPNYALSLFDREELAAILSKIDLVSVNETELQELLRCLGLREIHELHRVTPAAILVTRANNGARLHTAALVLELPSLSGRGGDVVGAGDAFLSGMLHGLRAGLTPIDAATSGSRAAAAFVHAEPWKLLGDCAEFTSNLLTTMRL